MDRIEANTFAQIHGLMPICCVDIVVVKENQLLLVRRRNEPAKDQLWFVGGRVLKNELLTAAAHRIVLAEAGLRITELWQLGVEETIFIEDPFGHGYGTHTINILFAAKIDGTVVLDDTSSEAIWVSRLPLEVSDYVRKYANLFEVL